MIGAAVTQMASSNILGSYGVSISPGTILVNAQQGAAMSPVAYSTVLNGVGPFTYQWTITGDDITINDATSSDTSFSASGFATLYLGVATLTVTDEGNANQETSKEVDVTFFFKFT